MRRYWKWIVAGLTILVGLPMLAYAFLVISFSGGIQNVIRRNTSPPNLDSATLKADRDKLEASINRAFDDIQAHNSFTLYTASKDDRCYQGQNNYKVTEGYAWRCTLRLTRYYAFDGNFRQTMIDFEKTLLSVGWQNGRSVYTRPHEDNMERSMREYYDARPNITVDGISAPDGYHTDKLVLEVDWAEKATASLSSLEYTQHVPFGFKEVYKREEHQDIPSIFKKATQDYRYVLAIAMYGQYFQN